MLEKDEVGVSIAYPLAYLLLLLHCEQGGLPCPLEFRHLLSLVIFLLRTTYTKQNSDDEDNDDDNNGDGTKYGDDTAPKAQSISSEMLSSGNIQEIICNKVKRPTTEVGTEKDKRDQDLYLDSERGRASERDIHK